MTTHRTTKQYLDAIRAGSISEAQIRGLTSQLHFPTAHFNRERLEMELTDMEPLRLTPEHTRKGLQALETFAERYGVSACFAGILDDFDRFEFVGFTDDATPFQRYRLGMRIPVRVYRIHDTQGRSVDYECRPIMGRHCVTEIN